MKKTILLFCSLSLGIIGSGQTDTISENIYQSSGRLGIGIGMPTHSLQITDHITSGIERNLLKINNLANSNSSYTGIILKTGEGDYQSVIQDYGINYTASPYYVFGGFLNLSNNSKGLMLHANSSGGIIKFYTGHDEVAGAGVERLRIDSTGKIGIGTKEPTAKLDVDGDVKLSGENTGLILKSQDGTEWKITVDNAGVLTTSLVTPPTSFKKFANPELQVNLHPNPSTNVINCEIINANNPLTDTEIYNLSGKMVYMRTHRSSTFSINVSDLENGYYVIKMKDSHGNMIKTEKIIKQ